MAFVLMHDAELDDPLTAERLRLATRLTVVAPNTAIEVAPNYVYVVPTGCAASFAGNTLTLQECPSGANARWPIDELFRSLARAYAARSAGIVLGFGEREDGAAGLAQIRGRAGLALMQAGTGKTPSSPQVDRALALDEIPEVLVRFATLTDSGDVPRDRVDRARARRGPLAFDDTELDRVTSLVSSKSGFDIEVYKRTTIERRVLRRMALAGLRRKDDYLLRLEGDPHEYQRLLGDLRIGVTAFFRDPDAFEALKLNVVEAMIAWARTSGLLRVWVAGCATGEEAYSLAIVLLDACEELRERPPQLQLFATDIDGEALSHARAGVYPASAAASLPPRVASEYFTRVEGGKLQIRSRVRDVLSFATHDLCNDPPFSRMDLVSCRNVLMYLRSPIQNSVLHALHFALRPGGYLWLGASETANAEPRLFDEVSKKSRIYLKGETSPSLRVSRVRRRASAVGLQTLPYSRRLVAGSTPRLGVLRADPARTHASPAGLPALGPREHEAGEPNEVVARLTHELSGTREELSFTALELEASTEELRASYEESSTIHEELQATNEELEATSEELRSLNQELSTVNIQLKDKLSQLEVATDDLTNFFASTRLATIFLSPEGRLRRFTPAAHDLLALRPSDVGRPVTELCHELLQAGLAQDASLVLDDLGPQSRDLETSDQRWMVRRTLPYRASDRRTAGVVVTFQDVTDFKRTEELLRKREAQQKVVSDLGIKALETRDLEQYFEEALQEVQRMLGCDSCCILELQPSWSMLLLRAGLGWKPGVVGRAAVPARANLDPGSMLRSREPALVGDFAEQPRLEPRDLLVDHGVHSGVSSVIHNERGVYGSLAAYHQAPSRFTADDANFLQAIANVIGSAVTTCQADLRAQLEQATNRLLSEPGNVLAVSTRILLQLGSVLGADICESWRKDPSSEQLVCECFETPTYRENREQLRAHLATEHVQPGVGLVGRVFSEGRALWLASVDTENDRGRTLESFGLTEGVAFPIVANHQTVGVMAFFARRHLSWDDQMLAILNKVGRGIGAFVTDRSVAFEQAHLAAIVASSDDAILSKDLKGVVQSWNPGAERIYGYTAAEMIGTPVARLFPEHLQPEADGILERISRGERVESYETVRVRKDGSHIDLSVTISPIRSDAERVVGASTIARDITEKKRAEKRVAEADRQKDQFLAMLGHELRNPLAAVRNATELLKLQQQADPTTTRIREILDRQTRHMAHLMDGLLDVSRIIRNKIDLKFEPVDLGRVVREVVDDYAARPGRNTSQLHVDLERERAWVRGDSVRLTQIVDNLIGNAVKFTGRDGSIHLTLSERHEQVMFSVRDTGRGISPELLPHVFDVFRQAQQSLDRTSGGLGLGLALVKLLTELHGGTVEATSEGDDRGAEFIVRIPAIPPPPEARLSALEPGGRTFDILVVEDNRDAATLLCELLEVAGHATELAYSAEAAWESLQRRTPEVLLCDLGLPGDMTGFDLARRIRSEPRFLPMRIIAVSGYGRPEDKLASRQAGFDAHLTKPVDFDSLQSILTQQAS
ncbi:MAG TPA: CheR family methyltransferase [Polyangiaceae bacterium]